MDRQRGTGVIKDREHNTKSDAVSVTVSRDENTTDKIWNRAAS